MVETPLHKAVHLMRVLKWIEQMKAVSFERILAERDRDAAASRGGHQEEDPALHAADDSQVARTGEDL